MTAIAAGSGPARSDTKPDASKLQVGPVDVVAKPLTSFQRAGGSQTRFGKLDFRGGLVLTAASELNFGGWSGLAIDDDGSTFIAVSDAGAWLTGKIDDRSGAPVGISQARMGPLLARDGAPMRKQRDRDAEAVALVSGTVRRGKLQIGFEQNARIAVVESGPDGLSATKEFLEKPAAARSMRRNAGLEAMTVMPGGAFRGQTIAMAERLYDRNRNHTGWIWTSTGVKTFHMTNMGDYDVTDIAGLEDGTLFVLERRFRWLEGVKMRIRRIMSSELAPGRTVEGETLIEANLENEIDNMEGLAVTRRDDGTVRLTLISDDNFNRFLQRTLLLQFDLTDAKTVKARP